MFSDVATGNRSGLRVDEVANLSLDSIDYQHNQIVSLGGKGAKDRTTYISNDAADALAAYLQTRQPTPEQKIFLVEKGIHEGKPLSVRGIQKRSEYYSKKSGVSITCHQLAGVHLVTVRSMSRDRRLPVIQKFMMLFIVLLTKHSL